LHDTVLLESAGLPTAAIITAAFVNEAHTQRVALGAADLEPVVITHPLSTLTDEEINDRALEAARQVVEVLTS
jgi:hypothetical protein